MLFGRISQEQLLWQQNHSLGFKITGYTVMNIRLYYLGYCVSFYSCSPPHCFCPKKKTLLNYLDVSLHQKHLITAKTGEVKWLCFFFLERLFIWVLCDQGLADALSLEMGTNCAGIRVGRTDNGFPP